jgi:hypothetical protein
MFAFPELTRVTPGSRYARCAAQSAGSEWQVEIHVRARTGRSRHHHSVAVDNCRPARNRPGATRTGTRPERISSWAQTQLRKKWLEY